MTTENDESPCPTCGRSRVEWSQKHREAVALLEKIVGGLLMAAGLGLAVALEGRAQLVGVAVFCFGAFNFFPDSRPLLSRLADRIPFLPSKTDK